jgi:heme exporter protein D
MDYREQQLMKDVMLRVRFIHGVRVLMSPAMVRAGVFLASVIATIALVSVPHVIENMSHLGVGSYAPYIWSAYAHTDLAVQAMILVALAAGAWFVRDIVRNVSLARGMRLHQA